MISMQGTDACVIARTDYEMPLSLLGPWLTQPSLGMLYGWRGTGKSFFSMAIAQCVAGGGQFLGWKSKAPSRVLYIDAELGMAVIKTRQESVVVGCNYDFDEGQLTYLTFEHTKGIIPNLANKDWQKYYSAAIADKDLVIFDHLSACVRPEGRESEADAWARVQTWAIKERENRKAILFVHHSGKSGTQLGSSTKEHCLDYVICLKRPANYCISEGCTFELHFEKTRHFFGKDAAPLYCKLNQNADGHLFWTHEDLGEKFVREVAQLKEEGLTPNDIATSLGVDAGKVKRALNQTPDRRRYADKEGDLF